MTTALELLNNIKLLQEMQAINNTLQINEDVASTMQSAGKAIKDFGNNAVNTANKYASDASAKIKAIIQKIIAWVKTAWSKLSAIIMTDTRFIQQYEKQFRANASKFDNVQIKLPNIKSLDDVMAGIDINNPMEIVGQEKQWYDAKVNELNQANANLKQLKPTTIGAVGGIIKIIDTMKKHAEYGKSAADGITKICDMTAANVDETDDARLMACGRFVRSLAMYRVNMAAARHRAYKTALVTAIGVMNGVREEAINGAVNACDAVLERYMVTVTEMFSDTGFDSPGKMLTYDAVDSYQQDHEKPADGVKGVSPEGVGHYGTAINVAEFSNITLEDCIDRNKLAQYLSQTVLEARDKLRQGR